MERRQVCAKTIDDEQNNLTQLRDRKSLQDRKLIVKYSTSVLSTPINFVQNSHLTLTDEWQNLVEELEGIRPITGQN